VEKTQDRATSPRIPKGVLDTLDMISEPAPGIGTEAESQRGIEAPRTAANSNMKIAPRTLRHPGCARWISTAQSVPRKETHLVIGKKKDTGTNRCRTPWYHETPGNETGLWDPLPPDSEALTKKKLEYNARTDQLRCRLFFTGGVLKWTPSKSLTSCPSSTRGKGFIGIHSGAPLLLLTGQSTGA